MTAALSSPTLDHGVRGGLRARLMEPGFRSRLAAMVRRRVPAGEADDVVQAVLCDALAAGGAPSDDDEIVRWICGIARNKVADFHRRARRELPVAEEPSTGEGGGDARVLLQAVLADASATARGQETLDWIVREHAGEELSRIAEESRLPAPAVRQRVSRLRRALRQRWLGLGGALVLAIAAAGGLSRWKAGSSPDAIAPDTHGAQAQARLARIAGVWHVDASSPLAKGATVRIDGSRLVVLVAGTREERAIAIDATYGDVLEGRIRGAGEDRRVTARFDGDALVVADGARSVRLVRAAP